MLWPLGIKARSREVSLITLLLVDDQPTVRRGLRMRLGLEPDLVVIGEAGDGEAALELVSRLRPDVVLMDIEMPKIDGISATEALRSAGPSCPPVVILTIHGDAATRARAESAGAAAFIEKTSADGVLIEVIRRVARESRNPWEI